MRSSSLFSVSVLALLAAQTVSLRADDTAPTHLGEVVISGGFTPIEAARYGRAHTVVTADEIKARGLLTVQDALRALPGVAVSGAGRSLTDIRIRGGETDHTLILIDGVKAMGGGDVYRLAGLDLADVERIEVLRGPQAAYYGSSASTGVINIISKQPDGTGYGGKIEAGHGHFAQIYTQTQTEAGGLRLSYSDSYDKGVDISGDGGERDHIDRQTLRLSGAWRLGESLHLRAGLTEAQEEYAYDDDLGYATSVETTVVDDPDLLGWRRERQAYAGLTFESVEGRLSHDLLVSRSLYKKRTDRDLAWDKGTTDTLKYRAQWGVDAAVDSAAHILGLSLERQRDRYRDKNGARARDVNAAALDYRGALAEGFDLQAGLRFDNNEGFGNFLGYNIGASYQLAPEWRLHASIGRASVNPTNYELYSTDSYALGNPDLTPEENHGADIGLGWQAADGATSLDATLFYDVLYDEISFANSSYINRAGTSHRKGLELSGQWQAHAQLRFGLNYTWTKATEPDGRLEVRRPRQQLGLNAQWQSLDAAWTLNAEVQHVAGVWDDQYYLYPAPRVELPNHTLVHIAAGYQLSDAARLSARVSNLFDQEHADVWGYAASEREVWLGLSADF